jgi:hypothetical protein
MREAWRSFAQLEKVINFPKSNSPLHRGVAEKAATQMVKQSYSFQPGCHWVI